MEKEGVLKKFRWGLIRPILRGKYKWTCISVFYFIDKC